MVTKSKRRVNPFYIVLVLAGVAFTITACAYGVMAVKQLHAAQAGTLPTIDTQAASEAAFMQFMDRQGAKMMLVELVILAVATFAAIGTDRFWSGEQPS